MNSRLRHSTVSKKNYRSFSANMAFNIHSTRNEASVGPNHNGLYSNRTFDWS